MRGVDTAALVAIRWRYGAAQFRVGTSAVERTDGTKPPPEWKRLDEHDGAGRSKSFRAKALVAHARARCH